MRAFIVVLSLLILPLFLTAFGTNATALNTHEWQHQALMYITNPNIIYVLLLVAIYGIFFELANPGLVLPGIVGILALLLLLYASQLVPLNYLGVILILCGIGFMIAEMFIGSFGFIGLIGIIGFIVGSILLFDTRDPNYHIDWPLIITMSIISFTFIFMILSLAIKAHKHSIITGREGLIGSEGVVLSVMNKQTVVRVLGEIWGAKSSHMLSAGDKVKVTHVQGLILIVKLLEKNKSGE